MNNGVEKLIRKLIPKKKTDRIVNGPYVSQVSIKFDFLNQTRQFP